MKFNKGHTLNLYSGTSLKRMLRGVNFYAYSVSGDDLLSVLRGNGVSVLEVTNNYMDFYGKTIGPQKFVRYVAMSAIEGCLLLAYRCQKEARIYTPSQKSFHFKLLLRNLVVLVHRFAMHLLHNSIKLMARSVCSMTKSADSKHVYVHVYHSETRRVGFFRPFSFVFNLTLSLFGWTK